MAILTHTQILKLHAAVISAELASSRAALLGGIDHAFTNSLQTCTNASSQILSDLYALNAAQLSDGVVPFRIWLGNALALVGQRPEADVFRSALAIAESLGSSGRLPGAAAREVEFASIALAHRETRWRLVPGRLEGSPFSRHCHYHLCLEDDTAEVDLPLDVTILNLASRPVLLSHIGIEVVECYPRNARWTSDEYLYSTARRTPRACRVKKEDTYVVEGLNIFRLLRPHLISALKWGEAGGSTSAERQRDAGRPSSGGREMAVLAVGETAWSQLDDPVYLEAGAPYRFDLIIQDVGQHLPSNLILRVVARTQLGEHSSSLIEALMSPLE